MSLSCVRSIKTLCVFSAQIVYSIRVNLLHRVCAGGSVFQYRHSPPVSLLVQQTGAFCAGKPCLKRELYGIAHGKIFFCEQLTNFSVKDNVVKMPYGGSKFRLRFFGTIMLTPCKANLAGYFCMFTALTTLPRVFIPLSHAGACLLAAINDNIAHLPFPFGSLGRAALCSHGHRSGVTYALAHLAAARTAGVRCAMKCRARPSGRGATIAAQNYLQICPATGRVARAPRLYNVHMHILTNAHMGIKI